MIIKMMSSMILKKNKGFTLIELMVSVSIFIVIMIISMGAILAVFDANKKSQTLRAVMDNLNFTLEAMTRTIRFGTNYHCDINQGTVALPRDCETGPSSFAVLNTAGDIVAYKLSGNRIARSINGGPDYFLTSADVTIQKMSFGVFGSLPYSSGANLLQPRVIIVIEGFAGAGAVSQSVFSLETTISQRTFDSQ